MLDVIAPENSQELWKEPCERHNACKERQEVGEGRSEKEMKLLGAFAESYLNAQHWSTRRQILSLMTDKLTVKELREFIPTVTSYCYNIARRHGLLRGRAAPLLSQENWRMRTEPAKSEYFVSFITSPHIIQDVPFRGKNPEIVNWRDHKNTQCYQNNDTRAHNSTVLGLLLITDILLSILKGLPWLNKGLLLLLLTILL